jgi:hypothetical protein
MPKKLSDIQIELMRRTSGISHIFEKGPALSRSASRNDNGGGGLVSGFD